MKKLGLIFMLGCIAFFGSCSDDKDDKVEPEAKDYAKEIAGNYVGPLSIQLGDATPTESQSPVFVTYKKLNIVDLELKNFVFSIGEDDIPVGDILLPELKVEEKDGVVKIHNDNKALKVTPTILGVEVTVKIKKAEVVGKKLHVELTILEALPNDELVEVSFDGDKKSSEAKILEATTTQKSVTKIEIDEKSSTVSLFVTPNQNLSTLNKVDLTFKLLQNTTSNPESGKTFNLSKGTSTVQVTAEDGVTTRKYDIVIAYEEFSLLHNMENWILEDPNEKDVAFQSQVPAGGWGTSNGGVSMLIKFKYTDKFNVTQSNEVASGKYAIKLETIHTPTGPLSSAVPAVTPASVFTGYFALSVFTPLTSTKFGVPFTKNPKLIKATYKYVAGTTYYEVPEGGTKDKPNVVDKKDEGSINGVLYEVPSYYDTKSYLTGEDINSDGEKSPVVARAKFNVSATSGSEYQKKDIPFEFVNGKTFDATKKYRLAIIASSSKDGDKFNGAPGSTLWIDNIEIVAE